MKESTIDDAYQRISELDKQMEEEKKKHAEIVAYSKLPFRKKMEIDTERCEEMRKMLKETFEKVFIVPEDRKRELFNEFFELVLDEKIKSMNTFCKEKGIKRKDGLQE